MQGSMLTGRVAVVTGGARGLGFAIAETFVAHGATVVVADVDGAAAAAAADRLSSAAVQTSAAAIGADVDVCEPDAVEGLVRIAVDIGGRLDVWVNNAGVLRDATMRTMSLADFRAVVDVHLQGTWLGMKFAAAHMRTNGGGAIVNMSSISGKVGAAGQTNYSAAKAGIIGMTKAAAKELGHLGIRVNAIQPGLVQTAMLDAIKPDVLAARITEIPLGRVGRPREVADAALFLASDMSSYISGVTLEVGGGRHI